MIPQPIINIAEICARKGIKNVVVSPGSRSAPLLLSFVRNAKMKTWIFPDERSAGYIACGMSAFENSPTIIICTSGTAALNLAPAVSEAFYQQIPLLVLTADRPPEWIDQYDNQTIRQNNVFGAHVKKSYTLPVTFAHPDDEWYCHRIISEAINLSQTGQKGPVHINVPLREPLYPEHDQEISATGQFNIVDSYQPQSGVTLEFLDELKNEWVKYSRILAVSGQFHCSGSMYKILENLHHNGIPIVADITSNLQQASFTFRRHDICLNPKNKNNVHLQPELLITWGKTVLSKTLKGFLRKHKPAAHWHIQHGGVAADTFQSLTRVINMEPEIFFRQIDNFTGNHEYQQLWKSEEKKACDIFDKFISQAGFGEFKAVSAIIDNLPDGCHLHLANSMAVRYANLAGINPEKENLEVFSNRGVSGIDGCSSFAVGTLLASGKLTVLITGDLAFFYDRNAFWHNYPLENLRVVLLNNHGGVIFRIIDGPNRQPELEEYFETRQRLNARNTAADFGFDYFLVKDQRDLLHNLETFFVGNGKPKIMEIETESIKSKEIFDLYKNKIKEEYET
jgi:2-succinyl-5-enolpyruvyl-6-hydroxy-3-cyclohexene-1-carboxylate synthase